MIPVHQTTFYDPDAPPDKQRGNCLTAVVASLLELPIEDVPNFVQDDVDHEGDPDWDWWTTLHRFITERGYQMHYLAVPGGPPSAFPLPKPGEHYAVIGLSPRGPQGLIHHIVIHRDGQMVHDPHPDGTGLVKITDSYHWTIREPTDEGTDHA